MQDKEWLILDLQETISMIITNYDACQHKTELKLIKNGRF